IEEYWGGDIQWFTPTEIKSNFVSESSRTITELGLKKSSAKILPKGTILLTTRATIGDVAIALNECSTNQGFQSLIVKENYDNLFLFNWIKQNKYELTKRANGSTFPEISKSEIEKIEVSFPNLSEQQKISSFLSLLDEKITSSMKTIEELNTFKKGIAKKIFSQQLRFKDDNGNYFPEWESKMLGEVLDYEQPTKYLVATTEYDDSFKTPVVTAGKTFILGYTNEEENIFEKEKLPVIIFDDFTTASQFIDFPFKAKSSAMKILKAQKGNDIKFIFEAMQMIIYETGGHGRHWISVFSNLEISLPTLSEQQKIANFLSSIDSKIDIENQILQKLEEQKNTF